MLRRSPAAIALLIFSGASQLIANVAADPRALLPSRLSRWAEVLSRESLAHNSSAPLSGAYAFDWKMGELAMRFASAQRWIESTTLDDLVRTDVAQSNLNPSQQMEWVKQLQKNRREIFGLADPALRLTRQSQLTAALARIDQSLAAEKLAGNVGVKWIFLWDATVESIRVRDGLGLSNELWQRILPQAAGRIAEGMYGGFGVSLLPAAIAKEVDVSIATLKADHAAVPAESHFALIWFLFAREGIESLIVLFCIVGGLALVPKKRVFAGAATALVISFAFYFLLAGLVSRNPSANWIRYFVLANAVASMSILLVATNFNFHRIYWSRWISRLRSKAWAGKAFFFAGLFAVLREGIELSLAMSLIGLDSGAGAILKGFLSVLPLWIGLALCLFVLSMRLPLRAILVSSGALMLLVTVVFAGFATRLLQAFEWISSTPLVSLDRYPPWFESIFAYNGTTECTVAMILTALVVFIPAIKSLTLKPTA